MNDNELDNIYGGSPKSDKVLAMDASNQSEDAAAYGVARDGTAPNMFELRLSDSEHKFIAYHLFQQMDSSADKFLSIVTTSCIVEIQGTQLIKLARRFARHEVEWIAEGKTSSDGVQINKITIHTSGETLSIE